MRHTRAGPHEAVSDIVGSMLLIGITVVMAGLMGLLLLAFEGPTATPKTDLSVTVDPGSGGWNTGDEVVRIQNLGGDPLDANQVTAVITVAGVKTTLTGASQLGSTFADGKLTIGETWQKGSLTIASGAPVSVAVIVNTGGTTMLLSSSALVAAAAGTVQPCLTDHASPTVLQWTQNPGIVTGQSSGAITVTVQLSDDCWGVNPNTVPDLYWRITPAATFTDQGPMSPNGLSRWTGTIPAQSWADLVGQTLFYHVGPLADLGGNSANTPDQSSVIAADCTADQVAPTAASLTQSPPDVRTTTSGAVTVTLVAQDDCAGVDEATDPHLLYRFNDGLNPGFTDAGPMTHGAPKTWTGTIPSQTWVTLAGQTIDYQANNIRDNNGNLGASAVNHDLIDVIYTYTYCSSNTPTVGTVAFFTNACSAGAGGDAGAEATLAEGGTTGTPATVTFNANGVLSSTSWGTPTNAFASDNAYATFATSSPTSANDLKLNMQDPAVSGTITQVVLRAEVSISGYSNDGFSIYACLAGGLCNAVSSMQGQSSTDVQMNYDVTSLRPGGGSWSWTDITNFQGVVRLVQSGTRDGTWRVDRVWVDITYTQTTYAMAIQLGWTVAPAGVGSQTLDLQYRVAGDTFNVQVCQDALPTCGTWTTRGATMTEAASTSWTYTLTAAEFNAGSPRIRFTDATPSGLTQGNIYLDWGRLDTL